MKCPNCKEQTMKEDYGVEATHDLYCPACRYTCNRKIKKYEKKLTPSGCWDNGVWLLSDETVEFPDSKIKEAIVETIKLKKGTGLGPRCRENSYFNGFKVTIDGNIWFVEKDPREVK